MLLHWLPDSTVYRNGSAISDLGDICLQEVEAAHLIQLLLSLGAWDCPSGVEPLELREALRRLIPVLSVIGSSFSLLGASEFLCW
jgi:hypothetical protein